MIQEAYCSYEVAKLLKEKGFKSLTKMVYRNPNDPFIHNEKEELIPNHYNIKEGNICEILAPTHQMAMKWLREVHKLAFIISPQWSEGDMRNPCRWYWEIKGLKDITTDVYNNPLCNTYEEAVEAAIKYCLENLI